MLNRHDSFTGLYNAPSVPGTATLRDLAPPPGTMQFPEALRDMYDDTPNRPAPPHGAKLDAASWPGCMDWRNGSVGLGPRSGGGKRCTAQMKRLSPARETFTSVPPRPRWLFRPAGTHPVGHTLTRAGDPPIASLTMARGRQRVRSSSISWGIGEVQNPEDPVADSVDPRDKVPSGERIALDIPANFHQMSL